MNKNQFLVSCSVTKNMTFILCASETLKYFVILYIILMGLIKEGRSVLIKDLILYYGYVSLYRGASIKFLFLRGNSQVVILPKPDARLKYTTE